MKQLLIHLLLSSICSIAIGQNDFTGIAKYKISSEGKANAKTDSMTVIFDKQRIKVILYILDPNTKKTSEMAFIDDFRNKRSFALNTAKKTYKLDSLDMATRYQFIDTWKFEAAANNAICFRYRADSTKLDRSKIAKVDCLGSVDYLNNSIKEYFFLGVQPIIVDNRIVMEFIVTKANGTKDKISLLEIIQADDVRRYFDMNDYKMAR